MAPTPSRKVRSTHGRDANVSAVIVSHPARVLFVHVQKTGGSTVQSVLLDRLPGAEKLAGLPGAKHAHLRRRAGPAAGAGGVLDLRLRPQPVGPALVVVVDDRPPRRPARRPATPGPTRRIANNPFWAGVLELSARLRGLRARRGPDRFARLRTPQLDYLRRRRTPGRLHRPHRELRRRTWPAPATHLGIEPPPEAPRRNADRSRAEQLLPRPRTRPRCGTGWPSCSRPTCDEFGYEF